MPRWLKGSFLALFVVTLFRPTVIFGSPGDVKTGSAAVWFLLAPPFAPTDPPGPFQLKAPLSQWTEMDSTETLGECEEQRNNMTRMSQSADIISPDIQFEMLLYHYAVCVSSSDSRLTLGRTGQRIVKSFSGFSRHDRVSAGYNGPPVEQSSFVAPESPPPNLEGPGIFVDPRTPILLILLALAIMAAVGPLGGWIQDKIGTSPTLSSRHSARGLGPARGETSNCFPLFETFSKAARSRVGAGAGQPKRLGSKTLF
jgi:hypothetical protein